jgi:hypothetical protein
MTYVGSRRKSGRSKQQHGRRRNQTSNSNVHSINPSWCLEAQRALIHHRDTIAATLTIEKEVKDQVDAGQMSADTTQGTGGEE